jgi:MtN3 and saliva related transmembrane protein
MNSDIISALGAAAAFCTTAAYLPQLVRAWRTRSTRDISLPWIALLVTGVALWLVYGLLIGDGPLIAANGVTLCFTASILYLKLRHG